MPVAAIWNYGCPCRLGYSPPHMPDPNSVPVYRLTETDFQRHPVWQFTTDAEGVDGGDESYVSPAADSLQRGVFGSFMVGATYRLTHGPALPGAVQVDILGAKVLFTPAFIYIHGKPIEALASDVATRLARITKTAANRPEGWRLNVLFDGESAPRSGRIARFRLVQAIGLVLHLISLRFNRRHR